MTSDTTHEVVETYRARRRTLIDKAREADTKNRPLTAATLRQAARVISRAIEDELLDEQPTGLAR